MHILLVDDDAGSLLGMKIALELLGHTCDTYTEPLKAMRDCIDLGNNHNYDAVVTDLRMPDIDGLKFAGVIQLLLPELKVIIVSGFMSEDIAQEVRLRGFHTLLHKPVSVNELAAALRRPQGV
ncbi:response regulator [Sporomusa acidovorans]|uniref:Response regulatory domain-containing protein n=1 Tax=Sporomusa acidovorans (strain ATCC 49682 / DSM 3132 / Mol) TaxID=1123286 RepID=A0ABZ3J877_SPOA4|nr:response regulator [Sporomusa acidovorans]OZC24341.1 cell cycle response regulator CtrA [Sporomusa acidovorans DSM 3132]SDF82138.1 Response regulator receiver domain-containing protein [Sporomusa acidovorans]